MLFIEMKLPLKVGYLPKKENSFHFLNFSHSLYTLYSQSS